ncbi:TadE/TadG family type IV pilus assembly protein [Sphingomonas sp. SUN039]|uniref:TadE/TadG family type IV pilus assembly protein n=1 Tax=Sphingomonas sp. SUN039 TaxID=2937787 RepID=UPI00216433ED|nr:TadE/TadG family type IV pilus assembly protein [Sphingomonas sp. SUN039]UVO53219.1 pilus assembly protein [Sphingomonas sp. SUN039]
MTDIAASLHRRSGGLRPLMRALRRDASGLALIEFAYGLPVLLGIGLGGVEIANLAVTRMRVSQIGMMVADNAARVGENNGLALKKVYEGDINDTFEAARIQGAPIDMQNRGRIIVSSLQQNSAGGQWIAWQRCWGNKSWNSSYGTAGNGKTGTSFTGMGLAGQQVQAPASNAVIFVEVAYDYDAIVEPFAQGLQYFGLRVDNQVITYKGAFIVRDPRQLGVSTVAATTSAEDFGLFQNTPAVTRRTC